ncbi:MAG: DUF2235 domain-containing protein [Alphaproteobacteria bacterium]
MPKNIVVCCDGTANEFEANRTNVAKLCFALVKDRERQHVYYRPGIGTMAPPGFVTRPGEWFARAAGAAFGYGLMGDVRDGYVFIMNHFAPGDRIFLFGFSRGAYTARVIAAMLKLYGLAMPGNEALIPYAVRMLWAITDLERDDPAVKDYFDLAQEFRESLAGGDCKPHFLGVWDTVSSVGWVGSPVALPYTRNNPDIAIQRHAVALDERRAFFRTNLLATPAGRDVRQVWFPGVHCDVGGGYPEPESGLSKIALQWMAEEARAAGLLLDDDRLATVLGDRGGGHAPPSPKATMHESLTWKWWPAEYVPKKRWDAATGRARWQIYNFKRREPGRRPVVHDAAWEVSETYARTLPADAIPLSRWRAEGAPAP